MRRLERNETWSFFDPAKVSALTDLYGEAFEAAYLEFEQLGLASSAMRARALWELVTDAVHESGTPFIMFADNINCGCHPFSVVIPR